MVTGPTAITMALDGDLSAMSDSHKAELADQVKDDVASGGIPKASITVELTAGSVIATATFASGVSATDISAAAARIDDAKPSYTVAGVSYKTASAAALCATCKHALYCCSLAALPVMFGHSRRM